METTVTQPMMSERFWKSMELATAALAQYRAENLALRARVAEAEARMSARRPGRKGRTQ